MKTLKIFIPVLALVIFQSPLKAQYFGQNKAKYDQLPFEVKKSPHFDLYHYTTDSAAETFIQWAEKWYEMHQNLLKDTIRYRNPLIVYNNHADFQQTTAIQGTVSVGTGGVTEGLKNRVVMPFMETHSQTNHVLGHELVHAFQYNILKTNDSLSIMNIQNLPLWLVEGMAEYLSVGREDPNTAMWMRDAIVNGDFPTIRDLSRSSKYFPYRYGQAFWAFVAGMWGEEVIRPLFINTAFSGLEVAADSVLGYDTKTLSTMWKQATLEHYDSAMLASKEKPVGREFVSKENGGRLNVAPAVSPDGRYVIFLSERDLFTTDLFLADVKTGKVIKKLASTSKAGHIDDFNYLESSGTWSPDGNRFAYTAFSKGETKLIIQDVFSGKTVDEFFIAGLSYFTQPSWSPRGDEIAVVGLKNGVSDIYTVQIRSKELTRLTNDVYSDVQPSWSPDGTLIVFATDRASWAKGQHHGKMNISVLTRSTGNIESLTFFAGADNLNPLFTTSNTILFLSNRDGYRNLYGYNFENNQLSQLTDLATGISGITPFAPAISFSQPTNTVYYTVYSKMAYSIYENPIADFTFREVNATDVSQEAGILPPYPAVKFDGIPARLAGFFNDDLLTADSITDTRYEPKFQLDYIGNTGVGVAVNSAFGTGLAGGVNMLFSDILGYNTLFAGLAVNGEIYDIGGVAAFLNQKGRIHWGGGISHIPYQGGRLSGVRDTITINDEDYLVNNIRLDILRTFEDKVNLFAYLPLNRVNRFETGYSVSRYSFRFDRYNNYYNDLGLRIAQSREKLDNAPDSYFINQANLAFVHDNSFSGVVGPLMGQRLRLQADQYFGEVAYHGLLADVRKYFWFKPISIGVRALHYGRYGTDAESERLYPLSISYPYFVRGYNNLSYASDTEGGGNVSINDLIGSRIFVSNLEVRLPFTGPERLALYPSRIFFTELALFFDGGFAWSSSDYFYSPEEVTGTSGSSGVFDGRRQPVFSTGLSLRINLFGQVVLEPFYAVPFQRNDVSGVFGLNFIPAW